MMPDAVHQVGGAHIRHHPFRKSCHLLQSIGGIEIEVFREADQIAQIDRLDGDRPRNLASKAALAARVGAVADDQDGAFSTMTMTFQVAEETYASLVLAAASSLSHRR